LPKYDYKITDNKLFPFQTLARQLAEVLLRGVCENSYVPPETTLRRNGSTDSLSPRRYAEDKYVAGGFYTTLCVLC